VDPEPAALPSRFEQLSSLGAGGMGEVYVVRDRARDVETALKVLACPGGAAAALFRHEFRCLADLRHPNLVRLGELFDLGDRLCFTMERVDGIHFDAWAAPARTDAAAARYDESRLRDGLAQLADGLAAIHGAGLVHRDLKPTNVMVTGDGRVVLLDFGIAILARDRHDSELAVGTAVYMAPEQARAESPAAPADLYALGIMLYEVLVGRPPFVGEDLDILRQKQRDEPTRPRALYPETPADLDVLCMELLARDPVRRPTASQVAGRLRSALHAAAPAVPYADRPRAQTEVFVGRGPELAALGAELATSAAGPVVQMVHGVSGIGKTALLGRFALAARDRARLISVGRCHQREHVRLDLWDALMEAITRDLAALPRE
jgi:serine/threonine protein kinase